MSCINPVRQTAFEEKEQDSQSMINCIKKKKCVYKYAN